MSSPPVRSHASISWGSTPWILRFFSGFLCEPTHQREQQKDPTVGPFKSLAMDTSSRYLNHSSARNCKCPSLRNPELGTTDSEKKRWSDPLSYLPGRKQKQNTEPFWRSTPPHDRSLRTPRRLQQLVLHGLPAFHHGLSHCLANPGISGGSQSKPGITMVENHVRNYEGGYSQLFMAGIVPY